MKITLILALFSSQAFAESAILAAKQKGGNCEIYVEKGEYQQGDDLWLSVSVKGKMERRGMATVKSKDENGNFFAHAVSKKIACNKYEGGKALLVKGKQ